jgi:hypothetical protein
MKPTKQVIALFLLCLVFASASVAQTVPPVKISGVYDNITVGKESGDLEGMRVIIFEGGGGYYCIVQIASGGAELPAPAMVKVNVKGSNIDFTVKEPYGEGSEPVKFSGSVTAAGLRLKNQDGEVSSLKRKDRL